MIESEVLIVGAGVTGLKLAQEAMNKHKSCIILEKSRGVGGRLATRRIENMGLDHGSPVDPASPEKEIKGGINKIPKAMACDLDIRKSMRVIKLEKSDSTWITRTESGESFSGHNLILTCPVPQALDLLKKSHITPRFKEELETISYLKAIMSLFITKEEDLSPKETSNACVHSLLSMKGRNLHPRGWVLRLSENLSEELFEQEEDKILKIAKEEFIKLFSRPPSLTHQELMKWRYAVPKTTLPKPFVEALPGLFLAGDGLQGDPLAIFSLNNF